MTQGEKTNKLVMTAMLMCLIMMATMFFKVPIPFANGYVHLGDAFIFIAVLVLGIKYGALAAAIGSALGDILGGFPVWAPWTFGIKGMMAIIMALCMTGLLKDKKHVTFAGIPASELLGMALAGFFMVAGYYVAEGVIYGSWITPLAGIPWNIGQFVVGMIVAVPMASLLYRTPAKKYFTYKAVILSDN